MNKEEILFSNDLVEGNERYLPKGENSLVRKYKLDKPREVHTTSGWTLILDNLYSIDIVDSVSNKSIKVYFVCNVSKDSTYSHIEKIEVGNRTYTAQRYLLKYVRLVCDVAYALGKAFGSVN